MFSENVVTLRSSRVVHEFKVAILFWLACFSAQVFAGPPLKCVDEHPATRHRQNVEPRGVAESVRQGLDKRELAIQSALSDKCFRLGGHCHEAFG